MVFTGSLTNNPPDIISSLFYLGLGTDESGLTKKENLVCSMRESILALNLVVMSIVFAFECVCVCV